MSNRVDYPKFPSYNIEEQASKSNTILTPNQLKSIRKSNRLSELRKSKEINSINLNSKIINANNQGLTRIAIPKLPHRIKSKYRAAGYEIGSQKILKKRFGKKNKITKQRFIDWAHLTANLVEDTIDEFISK